MTDEEMMIKVVVVAEELATAHEEFYKKLEKISKKHKIPLNDLVEMAIDVMKESDLNEET